MLVATVIDFPVHDIQYIVTAIIKPSNITSKPPVCTESDPVGSLAQRSVLGVKAGWKVGSDTTFGKCNDSHPLPRVYPLPQLVLNIDRLGQTACKKMS